VILAFYELNEKQQTLYFQLLIILKFIQMNGNRTTVADYVAQQVKLNRLGDMNLPNDVNAPQADVSNAGYLMGDVNEWGDPGDGDPDYGDYEAGDYGDYGDYEDGDYGDYEGGDVEGGDPDMLASFVDLAGDPDYGDPSEQGALRTLKSLRARARARKAKRVGMRLKRRAKRNTILSTKRDMRNAPGSSLKGNRPFFSVSGAYLNEGPIDVMSVFPTDVLKTMLDRQQTDTPFFQETVSGAAVGADYVCTSVGEADFRYYTGLMLNIGSNAFTASPGTTFRITATLPTIKGNLVISATPLQFTYKKGFDVRFLIFPWQLVANKPMLLLGKYSSTVGERIIFTVTGIPISATSPQPSSVSLIIPGSLHKWTVFTRQSLSKALR